MRPRRATGLLAAALIAPAAALISACGASDRPAAGRARATGTLDGRRVRLTFSVRGLAVCGLLASRWS
ncbi:MAG: hypothetical protein QOH43_947 [Solirubrobacteraceae bacterium]|jgi:hypothetical protein|nr:hypothetical protein [Solirubrobacteraceae bacterium]